MTELQKCELEILREVILICNKLKIRYYLVCGSALGAVKYNGFIPWDDDIDIGLFRDEYNRFLREVPKYLPKHLFLQNFQTDPAFPQIYSKIRNSHTTYIEKSVAHLPIHHGVYIDVFPLDGYPVDTKQQEKLEKKKRIYKLICDSRFEFKRSPKAECLTKLLRLTGVDRHSHKFLRKYERMIASYDVECSEVICNHGNWQGKLEYAPKEQYGEGTIMKFEGLDVRVPENYDQYLTQKYGNWRADPPKEQQAGHHYYQTCDTTRPYTDYVKDRLKKRSGR